MMLVRRKHWLAVSLSCSAVLLLLVLGGSRTPLNIKTQDGIEIVRFRDSGSEGLHHSIVPETGTAEGRTPFASALVQPGGEKSLRGPSGNRQSSSVEAANAPKNIDAESPPFRNSALITVDDASSGGNYEEGSSISIRRANVGSNINYKSDDKQLQRRSGETSHKVIDIVEKDADLSGLTVERLMKPDSFHNSNVTENKPEHAIISSGSLSEMIITDIDTVPVERDTPPPHLANTNVQSREGTGTVRYVRKGKKYVPAGVEKPFPLLVQAGVNAAKFRVSREYLKFPGDVNFKAGSPVPKNQVKRILILTTWRSGSTFLGDIFNAYPGTFYSFEPLHELLRKQHFQDGPQKADVFTLLKDIMKCDMTGQKSYFEYVKNNTFLFSHNSRYWQSCAINRAICYERSFFNQVCELMPVNVIKTVRLGGQPVQELLEDASLDLRVIHLVRDPRGTLHSRLKLDWCKSPVCNDPAIVCDDLLTDLGYSQRLQSQFPDRFLLVRYEDLGTRPEEMANLILNFVGLTFTDSVRHFIAEHTKLDEQRSLSGRKPAPTKPKGPGRGRWRKPTDAYSTFRDSRTTTFAWRHHFNYSTVAKIQASCTEPLRLLNFRMFASEKEYRNGNLSVMLPE